MSIFVLFEPSEGEKIMMCFAKRIVSAELHKREKSFRESLGTDSLVSFTS